jgi:hypothetical protein
MGGSGVGAAKGRIMGCRRESRDGLRGSWPLTCGHADLWRIGVHDEVEPPQEHRQADDRLEQRELVADALSAPAAERQVGEVGGHLVRHRLVNGEPAREEWWSEVGR